jgi:L-2-hydroxycarboxylate dehydrogenase (NAD+)
MKFMDTYEAEYKGCVWVDFAFLEQFMLDALQAAGVPADDARTVSEVLIESDRRGIDSHGIGRLKPIYIDRIRDGILNPVTQIEIVRERKTTAVLDGHNGMGHGLSPVKWCNKSGQRSAAVPDVKIYSKSCC